jgi:hypothetical protein
MAKEFIYTIDPADVDSALTDFPAVIQLGASVGDNSFDVSAVFTELTASDGWKKLIITDGGDNKLYAEVEVWDVAGEKATIHVKVSSVSATADTIITVNYDSSNADNTAFIGLIGSTPGQAVWESSFKAVLHMSQDPTGGTDCILDSTSNGNNGTPSGTMTAGDLVGSSIGKALEFDGGDDKLSIADSNELDMSSALTLEATIKLINLTGYQGLIGKGFSATAVNYYFRTKDAGLQMYFRNSANIQNIVFTSTSASILSSATVSNVVFTHTFGSISDSTFFKDGAKYPGSWTNDGTSAPKNNGQ